MAFSYLQASHRLLIMCGLARLISIEVHCIWLGANVCRTMPKLPALLRHNAGQEGRGEILLENSFLR